MSHQYKERNTSGTLNSQTSDHDLERLEPTPEEPTGSGSGSPMHQESCNSTIEPNSLGNSIFYDDLTDSIDTSFSSDPVLTQKAIARTQTKIAAVKEQIRLEQLSKEENVNEFLMLCANADKQQQSRMKLLFEKKNQKSAQSIAQLQKKLEEYQKRLKDLEIFGVHQKSSQRVKNKVQGLKSVGGNIINKPKELAHKLRLRHKFGSADNLNNLGKEAAKESRNPHGSSSLPRDNPGARGALYASEQQSSFEDEELSSKSRNRSNVASEKSYATSESVPVGMIGPQLYDRHDSAEWQSVMQELAIGKDEIEKLREELDEVKLHLKQELSSMNLKLLEERERCERLEDQLNDLTELHQNEVESIKSGVKDMEEKVQYQSEERLMDIKEHLQGLETKLNSLEHQHNQQQYINIDGLNNSESRAIFMKLITVALNFIHLFLWLLGTCLHIVKPFCQTRIRVLFTILVTLLSIGFYYQRENFDFFMSLLWSKHVHESIRIDKS